MNHNLYTYLSLLPHFFTLLPSALLCYFPMKNHLKYSRQKTILLCFAVFIPYASIAAGLCLVTKFDMNLILLPSLVLLFLFYKHSIHAELSCALSVFMGVSTLITFPAQFSYGFDAWLYPFSRAADFSMWAALFQLALSYLFATTLSVPCARIYSKILEHLSYPQVWYPLIAVHTILFLFNMLMIPHSYETLYVGRAFSTFFVLETVLLLLFLLLHSIFHHIAHVILKHAELTEHSRFL